MGAFASLESNALSAPCGESVATTLTVRNTGTVVDQFRISVLGDPGAWCQVDPPMISLLPGREGTVSLRFSPPRDPATPFGQLPFGVRVEPQEDAAGLTVEEGVLTVTPYADLQVDLVPNTSKGWRQAKHQLTVVNRGNAPVAVHCSATDPNGALDVAVDPAGQTIGPGIAVQADVRVKPRHTLWRGAAQTLPFTIGVQAGVAPGQPAPAPVNVSANLLQNAVFPPWLPRTLATIAALVIGAVVAWHVVLRPTVQNAASNAVAAPLAQTDENMRRVADKVGVEIEPLDGSSPSPGRSPGAGAEGGDAALGLPLTTRLTITTEPGGQQVTGAAVALPADRALTVPRVLVQNPYKATGLLVIGTSAATDTGRMTGQIPVADRLVVIALGEDGNTPPQPLVFDPPLVLPTGRTLAMTVQCVTPGNSPGGGARPNCEIAALVGGYTRTATEPTGSPSPRPTVQPSPEDLTPTPTGEPESPDDEDPTPSPEAS
ncbi:hypothetical protein F4553_001307 [Allocatelliglobosispora scoriae]|uniref:Hydrolytic protein n=1 Tax=Allocatelliglobosispora scoriae TaxID=643052 RepID=A0A841BKP1_9ACTN|nr:hypothetical protein [Allocatelliglobosispora scoriae]MBB5867928.1 hypothetical protein [Allocatelliglobosispora scoriae]